MIRRAGFSVDRIELTVVGRIVRDGEQLVLELPGPLSRLLLEPADGADVPALGAAPGSERPWRLRGLLAFAEDPAILRVTASEPAEPDDP